MTISNVTMTRFNETKYSLASLARFAIGRYTQKEANARAKAWINNFKEKSPKRTPKLFCAQLWAYWDGLKAGVWDDKTIFLYNVEGQFYTVSHDKLEGLPSWDTLPREQWDKLGDKGGIYWKSTFAPFFIN